MWELSILGLSHIVFGIILIAAKKKDRSDLILILWLIVLLMPFLQQFLNNYNFPFLRFNNQAFTLLNGPFLYLYFKEVTKRENSSVFYWPHFVQFIIFYVFLIIKPVPLQPGGPVGAVSTGFFLFKYFGIISLLTFSLYALFSLKELRKHRSDVKDNFAYQSGELTLLWLSLLPVLFITLLLIIVLFENSFLRNFIEVQVLHLTVFLLFALYLIFFGLRQKKVFPDHPDKAPSRKEPKKSSETEEEDSILLERLRVKMEGEKLYLNPVLSVYDLAKAAGVSRHHISSLLNENLAINFFQFVNNYRLEEVCRRLKDDRENRQNILEHAYDSGFNSKSSFNSLFKNYYGMTPSQYKKTVQTG